MAKIIIDKVSVGAEREPLKSAFGFKGNALTYLLQTSVAVFGAGEVGVGAGVQSVLWSDSAIFARYGEERGNELMLGVTKFAAKRLSGTEFTDPPTALERIFSECYAYACEICDAKVSETFVLNSLVPIDLALWMLYAKVNKSEGFDDIFPAKKKEDCLANIPLITYGTKISDVIAIAKVGTPIFKIKLGSDPDRDGDPEKMLAWDMKRALEIHEALREVKTEYTTTGQVAYYFDANGRYDTKDRLARLIDFMESKKILAQTVLFEEPFDEKNEIFLGDLPCTFAADESIHNTNDVKRRIELGYRALTLKPIAKTLSLTLKMQDYARRMGIQSFCADLTVNPLMREWNKCVAARLEPIRGMKIGIMESNGAQNYTNWDRMLNYLPVREEATSEIIYRPADNFSGKGLFVTPEHYLEIAKKGESYGI